MTSLIDVRPESERIALLLRRDGLEATRKWVERTVGIYEAALAEKCGYGSDPTYRPRLERAVREFTDWLGSASNPRDRSAQPGPHVPPTQA